MMRLPPAMFAWFHRLSARERALVLLVAGAGFIILNLIVINVLLSAYHQLGQEYTDIQRDYRREAFLAGEEPMWRQREKWLHDKQPVLANRDRAGTALYEQIENAARAQQMIITPPQIERMGPGALVPDDAPQAVTVEFDSQADWKQTVRFVATLQQPENFLVYDLSSLRSNPSDPQQIKGHFKVSNWYAPAIR